MCKVAKALSAPDLHLASCHPLRHAVCVMQDRTLCRKKEHKMTHTQSATRTQELCMVSGELSDDQLGQVVGGFSGIFIVPAIIAAQAAAQELIEDIFDWFD